MPQQKNQIPVIKKNGYVLRKGKVTRKSCMMKSTQITNRILSDMFFDMHYEYEKKKKRKETPK